MSLILIRFTYSMRDAIDTRAKNWENCTMCVQDFVSLSTNITAEITKQEVDNFVRMCQLFAKLPPNCYDDERKTTTSNQNSKMDLNANFKMDLPLQNVKQDTDFICSIEKEISTSRMPAILETRKRFEVEITSILAAYMQRFDSSLKFCPFGSTQYGVKIANANFNLMVSTSEFTHTPFLCVFIRIFLISFFPSNCYRW